MTTQSSSSLLKKEGGKEFPLPNVVWIAYKAGLVLRDALHFDSNGRLLYEHEMESTELNEFVKKNIIDVPSITDEIFETICTDLSLNSVISLIQTAKDPRVQNALRERKYRCTVCNAWGEFVYPMDRTTTPELTKLFHESYAHGMIEKKDIDRLRHDDSIEPIIPMIYQNDDPEVQEALADRRKFKNYTM